MTQPCLITRVVLHNFKSIKACSVRLSPLTFLIGPNASGKSNFLDALNFVADALGASLEQTVEKRGGIIGLRHRQRDEDPFVRFRIEMVFPDQRRAHYSFELEHTVSGPRIRKEQCSILLPGPEKPLQFHVDDDASLQNPPDDLRHAAGRELFLKALPEYRLVHDALANNRIYKFDSVFLRAPNPAHGELALAGNGQNLSRALWHLKHEAPKAFARIAGYLKRIFPPLYEMDFERTWSTELQKYDENGDVRICLIRQAPRPTQLWNLPAGSLSDGTLCALGILTALFQPRGNDSAPVIGIEEPENSLHLAAFRVLLEAFKEASEHRQVCVASHSRDVLETASISDGAILAVGNHEGDTHISPVEQVGRKALQESLAGLAQPTPFNTFLPSASDLRIFDNLKL